MDITPEFIKRVFNKSKIDPKYMDVLTNPEALATYRIAFTSKTVDPDNNYELLEYMGDVEANAAVVWYFYEAYPQLRCTESINTLNRLKIVHVSSESFSQFADDLGFWPHIMYNERVAAEKPPLKKSREALLEDVFEAFVGATQIILYNEFGLVGVCRQIIYNFIKPLFEAKTISFAPEDLYDAKTRLKELFEIRKNVPNRLLRSLARQGTWTRRLLLPASYSGSLRTTRWCSTATGTASRSHIRSRHNRPSITSRV